MITEIISGLWFSDIDLLKDPNFFKDNDINIIINLTDCDIKVDKNVSYINLSQHRVRAWLIVIGFVLGILLFILLLVYMLNTRMIITAKMVKD